MIEGKDLAFIEDLFQQFLTFHHTKQPQVPEDMQDSFTDMIADLLELAHIKGAPDLAYIARWAGTHASEEIAAAREVREEAESHGPTPPPVPDRS